MSATFASLRYVNYRYWFAATLIASTGTWLQRVAQDWYVLTVLTDHDSSQVAIPSFMTMAFMPFGYSVSVGIGVGFVTYALIQLVKGKARTVHPLMWLVSVLFIIYFLMGPIQRLFGVA